MHDSVYDIAGHDPAMARVLRTSLTKLANGPDGVLKEMAEGVLSGRVDLRQAAASDVYGDELGAGFRRFWADYERLDPEEREELARQAARQIDELRDPRQA